MNNEQRLREWLMLNPENILELNNLKWEVPLYGAYEMLSREVQEQMLYEPEKTRVPVIGRIDLIFSHKGRRYCSELKLMEYSNSNFWDSLKVLGYTTLYNWQNKTHNHPAILIPRHKINLEHHIIAKKLKLTIFGVTKRKDKYIINIVQADKYKKR